MANLSSKFPTASFWRSLQTLNVSRFVVSLVLLAYVSISTNRDVLMTGHSWLKLTSITYVFISLAFILIKMRYQSRFGWQLMSQIALDVITISILYLSSGGNKSGFAILFLFPLAGVGILAELIWGLFFASLVTLFLLSESVYKILQSDETPFSAQAGLYGAAYFAVVYLVNRLARSLIQQEALATQRGNALAVQQAINRLIISDMGDGILVIDKNEMVLEINPAAERMLGIRFIQQLRQLRLRDIPSLRVIAEVLASRSGKAELAIEINTAIMPWTMEENISFISVRHADYSDAEEVGGLSENAKHQDLVKHLKLRFVDVDNTDILNSKVSTTAIRLCSCRTFLISKIKRSN